MALTLYQYELSPYADKVRRLLRLKGVAYATVEVPVSKPGKFKHISPTGKFPALEHDGRIIVDSSDICRHLDVAPPAARPTRRGRRRWRQSWKIGRTRRCIFMT